MCCSQNVANAEDTNTEMPHITDKRPIKHPGISVNRFIRLENYFNNNSSN